MWHPLLTMSNKVIKLNFSQYAMKSFWNQIMQLPHSILSEIFSTDFITLWHRYTMPLRAAGTRSPGLSWQMRPIVLCVMGRCTQPDLPWSLCWFQHCSAWNTHSFPHTVSASPHTVLRWNYSVGLKALALRDKSLSCHKPDTSNDVGAPHANLICRNIICCSAF